MVLFMKEINHEMKILPCYVCNEVLPETCFKLLSACGHLVCGHCLEHRIYLLLATLKDWQDIVCPVEGCSKAIHVNEIKESID